jgi:hypothetical protein
MRRAIYHVTPYGDSWRVERARSRRADSVHAKKMDAVARAKVLATRGKLGQVKVHKKDGEIQMEWTYGKDPRRTQG